jgi:sulfur carrier protein
MLQLNARHVAVEVNMALVPRESQNEHVLSDGDRLEIVTLVGGG